MNPKMVVILFLIAMRIAVPALAQDPGGPGSEHAAWTGSTEQKMWGLMTVWAEAKYAFPWFDARPDLDWDASVRSFIPKVLAAEDQVTYYRVLSELITLLEDSHSSIVPPWGHFTPGFDHPPLSVEVVGGKFLVVATGETDEIRDSRVYPGLEILEVGDSRPVREAFSNGVLRYHTMGSTQANEAILPFFLLYGPSAEAVSLKVRDLDGTVRSVSLTRNSAQRDGSPFLPRFIRNMMQSTITSRELQGGVLYVAIPTLENDRIRTDFLHLIDSTDLSSVNGMILDLRGNMGGSSAVANGIVGSLIDEPVVAPTMTFPLYSAARRAWGRETQWATERVEIVPRDGKRYLGTLVLLTDAVTHSSAEDIVIELLTAERATVVGGRTAGGAGNAIQSSLPGGGMLRVSTFRAAFPDGHEYVGTGVVPDVEILPEREDIVQGNDPVLSKAIEMTIQSPPTIGSR